MMMGDETLIKIIFGYICIIIFITIIVNILRKLRKRLTIKNFNRR